MIQLLLESAGALKLAHIAGHGEERMEAPGDCAIQA